MPYPRRLVYSVQRKSVEMPPGAFFTDLGVDVLDNVQFALEPMLLSDLLEHSVRIAEFTSHGGKLARLFHIRVEALVSPFLSARQ